MARAGAARGVSCLRFVLVSTGVQLHMIRTGSPPPHSLGIDLIVDLSGCWRVGPLRVGLRVLIKLVAYTLHA